MYLWQYAYQLVSDWTLGQRETLGTVLNQPAEWANQQGQHTQSPRTLSHKGEALHSFESFMHPHVSCWPPAGPTNPLLLQAKVGLNKLQVEAQVRVTAFKTLHFQQLLQLQSMELTYFNILVVITTKSETMANPNQQEKSNYCFLT